MKGEISEIKRILFSGYFIFTLMSRLKREIEKGEQGKHWVDLTPESVSNWYLSQLCQLGTSESHTKIISSILILEDF